MTSASQLSPLGVGTAARFDWSLLRTGLLRDIPIHAVVLIYGVIVWPFVGQGSLDWLEPLGEQVGYVLALSLASAFVMRFGVYVTRLRPVSPIRQLIVDAREALRGGLWVCWIPLAVSSAFFVLCFTRFKSRIPELGGGFRWDETFAALDRSLHFGRQPWEWLQPLLGWPPVTFLLNVNYNLWFFLMWGMLLAFAAKPSGAPGRTRFFLAFFLTWTLAGNLLALVFSSAGPCYYALVVGGADPYAGLMSYLRETHAVLPIWALNVQDLLWADYRSADPGFGISAMPSLHNATALLMVLAARDLHPRLRPWLVAHMVLIALGSVHLGWHYAVDAYLSFVVTGLIWFAVTGFSRRWDARFAASGA